MKAIDIKNKGVDSYSWMCVMSEAGLLHNIYHKDAHILHYTFAYDEKNILMKPHWETIQSNLREF